MAAYSNTPSITDAERRDMKAYLTLLLESPELSTHTRSFPLSGKIGIYQDGRLKTYVQGNWGYDPSNASTLYIGQYQSNYAMAINRAERLAIIGTLIGLCGLEDDLRDVYLAQMSKILLDQFNTCANGLIQVTRPAVEIAIKEDKTVLAVRFADSEDFYINGGTEIIEIDNTWSKFSI